VNCAAQVGFVVKEPSWIDLHTAANAKVRTDLVTVCEISMLTKHGNGRIYERGKLLMACAQYHVCQGRQLVKKFTSFSGIALICRSNVSVVKNIHVLQIIKSFHSQQHQ
jgi:hypothetical protein